MAVAGKYPGDGYTDARYTAPPANLSANLGRMPTVDGSEGSIGQSTSIYYYVGAQCNLLGDSVYETAKILELNEHLKEMKDTYFKGSPYGTSCTPEFANNWFDGGGDDIDGAAQNRGNRYLTWFLGRINASLEGKNGFAVGARLSLGDILIYNYLEEHLSGDQISGEPNKPQYLPFESLDRTRAAVAKFPKIAASIELVKAHPGIKKWLAMRGPQLF
jgi:glutathione S-transferase